MTHVQEVSKVISDPAKGALRREKWYALGKFEALEFVLENTNNTEQIKARIQEIEEFLSSPDLLEGPLPPGSSTRFSREGYLAGLKEALDIIANAK